MLNPTDNQDRLVQLRGEIAQLDEQVQAMCDGRTAVDFTPEEITTLEEFDERRDYLTGQAQARERIERISQSGSTGDGQRRTQPDPGGGGDPADRAAAAARVQQRDPTAGFAHLGEFSRAVMAAQSPQPHLDDRLARMAPTSISTEGAGADGGYLIPPEFSARVMEYVGEQNSLYSMVDKTPVNHQLAWPVDEESPWSTSGPQAYWDSEASQMTQSKLAIRSAAMKLNKVTVLCPVTDELMEDAPQLGAYLQSVISKRLRWKVDFGIVQGTGAGMPLGILNAPALKSVAKESAQTADTVNSTNIIKMFNALYGDYRNGATWLINQDVEPQLFTMVVAGTSSDVPIWLPAGSPYSNFANSPNGSLFGRPIIPHQACETLGDHGDVLLCDLSQYIVGYKTLGPSMSESIHLWFDYNLTAVKATWRIAGMPKWSTTISARDGSATYSPFVSLAARA